MSYDYETYVTNYSSNFKRVVIDPKYLEKIKELAEKIVRKKND